MKRQTALASALIAGLLTAPARADRGARPPATLMHSGTLRPNADGFTRFEIHRATHQARVVTTLYLTYAAGVCAFVLDEYHRAPPPMHVHGVDFHGTTTTLCRGHFNAIAGSFIIERPGTGRVLLTAPRGTAPVEIPIEQHHTE